MPPGIPPANTLLREQLPEELSQSQLSHHLDESDISSLQESRRWERPLDLASLATAHQPVPWQGHVTLLHRNLIRQILGLNPFKTSYFALYRPLKDFQSKAILVAGIILAMAAGVPLPLIGIVFGKIINSFPPPEEELKIRLTQLMAIAVAYFVVTWGWSVCWAVIGERVSRKTREDLLERALGLDMAYFDVTAPDMTNILTEKTQTIQLGTSEKMGLFITSISYFLTAFAVGFTLNAKLTAVMFVTVIPAMGLIVVFGTKYVSKFSKQAAAFTEKAASVAESAIRAVQVVQAFGVLEQLAQDHAKFLRSALRSGIRKSIAGALMLGSVFCIAYAANALAFWYGHRLRQEGGRLSADAGTIYAVVFLILDASFVIGSFGPFIQTFALAAAAGQSVFSILDQPEPEINVYSTKGKKATNVHFKEDLNLQDVSFVYPARPTVRVLDGVSLRFPAGKVTGVVGPSGKAS